MAPTHRSRRSTSAIRTSTTNNVRATQKPPVGASLLAKIANDNACNQHKRGALEFFASKLAPT
ncbi:hypothetical protein CI807_17970 [Pseudomonas sp. NS1(2017)]|nr:hypothetical protein CI807_17970 [Pseudomonas sp. NS1(2017)]